MTLHLIKLCVGVNAVEELEAWIADRLAARSQAGEPAEQVHVTRMVPTRKEQLLAGGSLFWVIKGHIQVRQRLLDIEPFQDKDGVRRCRLKLEPVLVATSWQPRRPFQGWRYLAVTDAPSDLGAGEEGSNAMPTEMRRELAALGLL